MNALTLTIFPSINMRPSKYDYDSNTTQLLAFNICLKMQLNMYLKYRKV
jgi:hypothetical protein